MAPVRRKSKRRNAMTETAMPVRKIKIGPNVRRAVGDVSSLICEIDRTGLPPRPIVVTGAGELIAGAPELLAWRQSQHRRRAVPVCVLDIEAVARGEQACPAKLAPSEAVTLARLIEPAVRAEAKRRQGHGLTARGRRNSKPGVNMTTRDMVAARCGMSPKTLWKATLVIDAATETPEQYDGLVARMDDSCNVDSAYRTLAGSATVAVLRQPSIFATTMIGRKSLGEFSIRDLRWLASFFREVGPAIRSAPDAGDIAAALSVTEVRKAIDRANRYREGKLRPISVTQKRPRGGVG